MNILELYSGVGGMHMAFNESGIRGKIVGAVEISTVANTVYRYNFPATQLLNKNVQALTPDFINKLNVNTILMSPPCQPFTRNGLKRDESDPRACSFIHLLDILPDINIQYILLENVKGFETSIMREKLINRLKFCNYDFQEFMLSPTQFGVSNTRHRYYCIAKKCPLRFRFRTGPLKETIPNYDHSSELFPMSAIIERNIDYSNYSLPENILLKYTNILDICHLDSKRSCCFTKAYGKYVEGSGSVFTTKTKKEIDKNFKILLNLTSNGTEYINCAKMMNLRFFTPKEISRLMSFPEEFAFPNSTTKYQKYKLLGNSINVKVVSKLLKVLYEG